MAPTPGSLLFLIPAKDVVAVVQAIGSSSVAGTLNFNSEQLVASINLGRRVQAMTTLPDGAVLFAVSVTVGAV